MQSAGQAKTQSRHVMHRFASNEFSTRTCARFSELDDGETFAVTSPIEIVRVGFSFASAKAWVVPDMETRKTRNSLCLTTSQEGSEQFASHRHSCTVLRSRSHVTAGKVRNPGRIPSASEQNYVSVSGLNSDSRSISKLSQSGLWLESAMRIRDWET